MKTQLNPTIALQLFIESILTVGTYNPSEAFLESESVGIALDTQPILLLGYSGDKESNEIIDRLLLNDQFIDLVDYAFGTSENLKKVVVKNQSVCKESEHRSIVLSEQGVQEDGKGSGALVAVLPFCFDDFATGLCINSSIMQCFYPTAAPLSTQIGLKPIMS